jgi:alpha-N-arabinofuranosidase
LLLFGNPARLDDGPPVTFVGRRQQHFNCVVTAALDFVPSVDHEEAGLTVWMNPQHHYDLFVSRQPGQRWISVRRRIGSLSAVVAQEVLADGALILRIAANANSYSFGYTVDQAAAQILATGETRYLSTEVAGGFTGVYFGIYATGNGQTSATAAAIDWFDYQIAQ